MELMPHNQKAVNEILEEYGNGIKSIIYVAGVGVGKSFVFMGVAEQIKGKILYILPKHAISENVKSYKEFYMFADRTDFVTFNYFSDESKYDKLDEYELVVVDEAHHIGSDLYGKHLLEAISKHSCKVLGLTATPIRMTGDVKDVTKLFESCVRGLSNFEAITQGLMPQIEYLVCAPEEIDLDSDERLVVDLDGSYELLKEAIETNPKDKWICFCPNINELHKIKSLVKKLFPDHKVLEIHSKRKDCNDVLRKANEEYDKCVMLNCDMLLEGLHFSGVNGIIIFRNVHSIPVFEQIIGRVSSMGKKENPLVIDCTDTWMRMDNYIEEPEEPKVIEVGNGGTEMIKKKPCFVSLKNKKYYDYMQLLKKRYEQTFLTFEFRGELYPCFKDCCNTFGVSSGAVHQYAFSHSVEDRAEALELYLQFVEDKKVVFRGVEYASISKACEAFGFENGNVQCYARSRNCTWQEALEHYICNGMADYTFEYEGAVYETFRKCCETFNVSYNSARKLAAKENITKQEAISRIRSTGKKHSRSFIFQGTEYDTFAEACRAFGKDPNKVKVLLRNNPDKVAALDLAIETGKYDIA